MAGPSAVGGVESWLLDFTSDGVPYAYATIPGELDGVVYQGGLSDDLAVPLGADSVTVTITDPSVDWPAVVMAADGADGTLRRTSDNEPVTYVSGEVRVLGYGTRDESVTLTLSRRAGGDVAGRQVPDALSAVLATQDPDGNEVADTWPDGAVGAEAGDVGRYYPVILGLPGYLGAGDDTYPVVPIPLAQFSSTLADTKAIVSEDPAATYGSVALTEVLVRADTTGTETTATLSAMTDARSKIVLGFTFAGLSLVAPYSAEEPRDLYAGFYPSGGGGPRDAYSVLVYLLTRWGGRSADMDRIRGLRDSLARFFVDTWIDRPAADPWTWWSGSVLRDLPYEIRTGDAGLYLVERRYVSDPSRNVGSLVEGGNATRTGGVSVSEGPVNEFVARYRANRDGDWMSSAILTGREGMVSAVETAGTVAATVRDDRCSASAAKYGPRTAPPLDLDWTWDDGTVLLCLSSAADATALPARLVSYEVNGGQDLLEADEVTLYDEDRGFAGVPAIVDTPPVVSSSRVTVSLRVPA